MASFKGTCNDSSTLLSCASVETLYKNSILSKPSPVLIAVVPKLPRNALVEVVLTSYMKHKHARDEEDEEVKHAYSGVCYDVSACAPRTGFYMTQSASASSIKDLVFSMLEHHSSTKLVQLRIYYVSTVVQACNLTSALEGFISIPIAFVPCEHLVLQNKYGLVVIQPILF